MGGTRLLVITVFLSSNLHAPGQLRDLITVSNDSSELSLPLSL